MRETLTVCGSMRFSQAMQDIAYTLETQYGFNILQCTYGGERQTERTSVEAISSAHYHKIDLSDGIYVVDFNGYIGESVAREIEYAKVHNKKIYYHSQFMPDQTYRLKPNHLVSCAALVTDNMGKILLVKSPWRGWEYPGGLMEPGETFQEALKREVQEEAGVKIEITGFIGICKNIEKNIVNIDFSARYLSGELQTSEESSDVIWATPEEAMDLITFPLTKKRLENMLRNREEAVLFCFKRDPFAVIEDQIYKIGYNLKQAGV